jgi:hypothetical protein
MSLIQRRDDKKAKGMPHRDAVRGEIGFYIRFATASQETLRCSEG